MSSPHTNEENLAQSWCSITSVGRFDAKKGGHLVLWDLGLVFDFPAGSTALIPSALIVHPNTSIQQGETRFLIVQYAVGGLFRWVNNGHMKEADKWAMMSKEDRELEQKKEPTIHWQKATCMYTKVDDLRGYRYEWLIGKKDVFCCK